VGNLTTFKVDCDLGSHTQGLEVGLISNASIPYGNMEIRPYLPQPVFLRSDDDSIARDGVKVPAPTDDTIGYGADTLLNEYTVIRSFGHMEHGDRPHGPAPI
jgi:hypothetical protein